jgi:glutaredoxin 3
MGVTAPKITIYTKGYCPFCHDAKALLNRKGVAYEEIDIQSRPEERDAMVQRAGGRTTVPQIFIGATHVGGCDDIYALEGQGGLDPLLRG